ncbi:hypothetical protein [Nocardioides luteus]|uniref:Uncharacterized protein n=1 Tax=Nocardioides luteus TaxID=1844 RepID=A0A1J4N2L0_9ACTN|nr:hypothetical protein [Nocardioides luteus]OIJ24784.1 hypothetical protein UG56_021090 [Nocardioides luteus]
MIWAALILAAGVIGAGVSIWQHLGLSPRARSWANAWNRGGVGEDVVLIHLPCISALAVTGSTAFGLVPEHTAAWTIVGGLFLLTCIVYPLLVILPTPPFIKPTWYRESRPKKRAAGKK